MKKVLVIFGGRSSEHDVSIITAQIIIDALRASGRYKVFPLYIAKNGSWYSEEQLSDINTYRRSDFEETLNSFKKIQLLFENGLTLVWPGLRSKKLKIDVVFPATHGTYGEDGSLMGLIRMAGVPFVGCDLEASVIAMDKVLTKQVTMTHDIPSVKFIWFSKIDWKNEKAKILSNIKDLKLPLFVKPAHLGSSIGITKVTKEPDLENAIEVAMHYDDKIIVEEGVENLIEVTCPILGNHKLRVAMVEQPLAKSEFFDFQDKYIGQGKKSEGENTYSKIPADISEELTRQVEDMTKATFRAIGGSGTARIDFLIDSKTNKVYLNEINPLPGSLYHHNWKKAGISTAELVSKLIELAEEKFTEDQKINYTFRSSILNQSRDGKLNNE